VDEPDLLAGHAFGDELPAKVVVHVEAGAASSRFRFLVAKDVTAEGHDFGRRVAVPQHGIDASDDLSVVIEVLLVEDGSGPVGAVVGDPEAGDSLIPGYGPSPRLASSGRVRGAEIGEHDLQTAGTGVWFVVTVEVDRVPVVAPDLGDLLRGDVYLGHFVGGAAHQAQVEGGGPAFVGDAQHVVVAGVHRAGPHGRGTVR
jgi:hypothetical protein